MAWLWASWKVMQTAHLSSWNIQSYESEMRKMTQRQKVQQAVIHF